ncbi:MAG: sigma factor-like helix-turn-helix DNA-binding protein, partial [Anaerolineales bacterium]
GALAYDGADGKGVLVGVAPDWVEHVVLRRLGAGGPDPVEAALAQLKALADQAKLSPRERQVFQLKVENPDWPDAAVGRAIGLKGSTVRVLAHRARQKLIPCLPPEMVRRAARLVGRSRLRRGRFVLHVNGDPQLMKAEKSAEPTIGDRHGYEGRESPGRA